MPKTDKLIFSLNGGELTPLLDARIDQSKYEAGCRDLQNMIPLVHGGATRRPGTEYITGAISSVAATKSRLVGFQFSVDTKYVLEFGNQTMRVFKGGASGGIVTSGGNPYALTTPYLTADLFELKFEHSNDVMYITHENYEPRILARTGDSSWTLTVTTRKKGPFLDENTTEATTITPSDTSGSITLTASAATFDANHAPPGAAATDTSTTGAIFRLMQQTEEREVFTIHSANGSGSTVQAYQGDTIDFITFGTWTATVVLERSYDSGATYEVVWTTSSDFGAYSNDRVEWVEENGDALYRSTMSGYSAGSANVRVKARARLVDRYVQITAVASSTSATATVLAYGSTSHAGLPNTTATWRWSEGAWSEYQGWPKTVAISNEDRLMFGGSTSLPLTVWGSKAGDYTCFYASDDDDAAVTWTLTGQGQQNEIHWMAQKQSLILGTAGGEHRLGASNPDEPMTPTNVKAKVQTTYGSEDVQAMHINDAILFVQRGGRKVREMVFSLASDAYEAKDITVFSEHITTSGIVDWAYQKSPDPILWCVLDNGEIAAMSYDRNQNVYSWTSFITETLADA